MDEILDELEVKNSQKTFSVLSFIVSLITLGLLIYIVLDSPKTFKASEGIPSPPMIIIRGIQIFCIIGIIMTSLSFIRKESSNRYKWIGGILNVLIFLLIIGLIIFARIIDQGLQ